MNRFPSAAWLLGVVLFAGCAELKPVAPPEMPALGEPVPLPDDPHRYFDFWLGEWNVQNINLQKGGKWKETGEAVARINAVAEGFAVLEQWKGVARDNELIGHSLRAYDPRSGKWVIWLNWHGGRPSGFFEMHGQRNGERLEQFPPHDDTQLRYSFSLTREDSAQWDEAKSSDGGESWITTWVMQFTRRGDPLPLDATNAPIVEPPESAAEFEETQELSFLIGAWNGTARAMQDGSWSEGTALARVTSMIEGFGLLQFVDTSFGDKSLAAMGWDGTMKGWLAIRVDNGGEGPLRMTGEIEADAVTFTGGELRESWVCPREDGCSWRREVSSDGGQTWQATVEVEFERSASTAARIAIPNARATLPGLISGGQPTVENLEWAARNGYRTVINLRTPGEGGEIPNEDEVVTGLGMQYVSLPVAGADGVTAENAERLAEVLQDDEALPILLHCGSGERIGALLALKAHELDGLPPDEALEFGRASGLTRLEPLVREKLGLSD
jgi:uncharacterized protein (TIGR01244 family)